MSPDVLGDLCRRIRGGMTDVGDAEFLEWVFRDQAGWIKPKQGLPDYDQLVYFIPDGYTTWLLGDFSQIEEEPRRFAFVILRGESAWPPGRVHAWKPAPASGLPDWLSDEEARDATD